MSPLIFHSNPMGRIQATDLEIKRTYLWTLSERDNKPGWLTRLIERQQTLSFSYLAPFVNPRISYWYCPCKDTKCRFVEVEQYRETLMMLGADNG